MRELSHQNEPPACIGWHRHNRTNAHLLVRELVLAPVQSFISAEQDVVGGLFIVGHNQDRPRVTKLPQVRALVHFLPSEPSVATQEGVTLIVRRERVTHVPDAYDQSDDRRAAQVSRPRVNPSGVAMEIEDTGGAGAVISVAVSVDLRRCQRLPRPTCARISASIYLRTQTNTNRHCG